MKESDQRRCHASPPEHRANERLAMQLTMLLKETGGDVHSVLRNAQLASSDEDFVRAHIHAASPEQLNAMIGRAFFSLANSANCQDGRPSLRTEDWRMLFFCLVSSRTLREAIVRACDFYQMLETRWGRMNLQVHGATAELCIDSMRTRKNLTACVVDTMGIAALHSLFGWLIGQAIPVSAVLLDYDATFLSDIDSGVLPFPLTMAADRTAIRFASEYLDFPVIRSAQEYGQRLTLGFAFELHEDASRVDLAERVRRILYQNLRDSHRLLSLQELSNRLGKSHATLRRQLSSAGTSYNQIKDSCRRELGLDLLRRSTLSVEAIADRLGFCDSDAFRRSFREWIGVSPSAYRRTAHIEPPTARSDEAN